MNSRTEWHAPAGRPSATQKRSSDITAGAWRYGILDVRKEIYIFALPFGFTKNVLYDVSTSEWMTVRMTSYLLAGPVSVVPQHPETAVTLSSLAF